MKKTVVAVTMGDPAGIGPEICLRALNDPEVLDACVPVVIGNAAVLEAVARRLRLPFSAEKLHPDDIGEGAAPAGPGVVDMHILSLDEVTPGRISPACGHVAYQYVTYAIDRTMAGDFDAMATAPLCKEALESAGIHFPGHTEILAQQTHTPGVVMMLTSPRLTVSLVTTHTSLRSVPAAVTRPRIERAIEWTDRMMRRLLGHSPRIGVLALNCHAGEGGLFGDEERRAIRPAIDAARSKGLLVSGPLPPDTAFTHRSLELFDAFVCMYHDQGLIPFKALSFEDGVNVTLGLPIVRTSVDHGTAFDIAWKGAASPKSLIAAILLAARLAEK